MADKKISQLTAASTPLAGTEVLPIVQSSATVKVAVSDLTAGRTVSMTSATLTSAINIQTSATNRWIIQKDGAGQDLFVYRYNDAGSYAGNPLRVDRANGVITWENGLAQGTAATGINFTANTGAAGMTSQLLNWYEEGTWTPTLGTTGTSFTSVTYDPQVGGRYVRIGKVVHVQGYMRTDAVTVGSASGLVTIASLPFTAVASTGSTSNGQSAAVIAASESWTTNNPSSGRVNANTTYILLYYKATANGDSVAMPVSAVATGADSNIVNFTATYICA